MILQEVDSLHAVFLISDDDILKLIIQDSLNGSLIFLRDFDMISNQTANISLQRAVASRL